MTGEIEKTEKEEPQVVAQEDQWSPKTKLGLKVVSGEIHDINYVLDHGLIILEPKIVDA